MKLEVGQFVRTKRDGIGKIISLSIGEEDECCFIELAKRRTGIKEHNIVKASHNIIDLIEVGDYVNGEYTDLFNLDYFKNHPEHIKSIVTKEQFEAMQYKVVEE